jgi:predicted CopG family antitoxin
MAVKTITIDMDAYRALKRHKGKGMSFSDVIKRHFGSSSTGSTLLRALDEARVSDSTLDAVDRLIDCRTGDPASAEPL